MRVQTDFSGILRWLSNEGLEVVLLVLGAALLTRVIGKIARMWTGRIDAKNADKELWSEESKHLHSLIQVLSYVAVAVLYVLFGIQILLRFGVNLVALVAPATVLGAALGFGAQKVVQDFLAGFFVLAERQYGYGDIVELTTATGVAAGTIEDVTLRVTRLRTLDGEAVIVPNGQIVTAVNQSQDWARAIIDVPVPNNADMDKAHEVLAEVCRDIVDDDRVGEYVLDEPSVMGVQSIKLEQTIIRLLARTKPGMQWEVGRRMRAVILRRFRQEGIVLEPEALAAIRAGMLRPQTGEGSV
ncbi:mechanosensitive ion channel protein MscS [Dietzia sp. HMSC21D01]|uniref:Mechanosensitive ion channel family protein n=1 Tax=Dietzia cinnamea TaxID=321318 RepID=A0AAW5QB53_9ACTN|nr:MULTISPECIES: mechanosensitive ion channel family protein [Dietzia]KZO57654.1 mechanosensitive ion channel protein MscS [Dietzia maris]MCT1865123.1 mechanosensitive ion channel family protein [Dietzia cinnamea]MCT2031371.1 mechanosensitive ion channel family protein [Dietzia cinnamea]MCT2033186.1 mechanosensitive ion channel family protein [Dietzia cinnamea]MCT2059712.1 mechanosensitive ion channel family protein [Dietzia cinnamea]